MSKFDIPTLTASCPACKLKSIHRVVLENTDVRHLRCDACDAAHVCAAKGSYQAAIHALAFEDLEKVARQGAVEAYSIRSAYHPMGGFEHPKFGLGYVFAILSPPKKMEVVFSDKVRFLVCGPGSGVTKSESEEEAPEGDQAVASNTAPDNSSADGPPAGSADGEAHS